MYGCFVHLRRFFVQDADVAHVAALAKCSSGSMVELQIDGMMTNDGGGGFERMAFGS